MFGGAYMSEQSAGASRFSGGRVAAALVVGLVGSILIWLGTPFSTVVLRNQGITDYYLATAVVMGGVFLVLIWNPIFWLIWRRGVFTFRQIALAMAIMFAASSIVTTGLLSQLPYGLAQYVRYNNEWPDIDERHQQTDLPDALFPGEMTTHGEYEAAKYFIMRLPDNWEGGIPWDVWALPAVSWLVYLAGWWLLMIGLSAIVLPQWRRNERLQFPLVRIQQELIAVPGEGHLFPPLLRKRGFLIASGVVVFIYLLYGLHSYFPLLVPPIPLYWGLGGLFADEPLQHAPSYVKSFRIYFVFIGLAYFMPSRVGFSIWFFMLFYAFYRIFGQLYNPPFNDNVPIEHNTGVIIAMTVSILWLGRAHWVKVFSTLFFGERKDQAGGGEVVIGRDQTGPGWQAWLWGLGIVVLASTGAAAVLHYGTSIDPAWGVLAVLAAVLVASLFRSVHSPEGHRDKWAAFMFLLGVLVCIGWVVWAGGQAQWGLLMVVIGFMFCLIITRVVCESGIPYFGLNYVHFWYIFSLFPIRWVSVTTTFLLGWTTVLVGKTSRMSLAAVATQARALDDQASPKYQTRLSALFMVLLIAGFFAAGGMHIMHNYEYSQTLDSSPQQPINSDGLRAYWEGLSGMIQKLDKAEWDAPTRHSRPANIAMGGVVAGLLQWACMSMPKFPLHPIGLLLAYSSFGGLFWVSILMGWLCRVLIVFFGGARLYSSLRPVFIGLIMGEVLAVILWFFVTVTLYAFDIPYRVISVLPG